MGRAGFESAEEGDALIVLMINGSFGVGKTTVAQLLRSRLDGARIFDPERIGYVLRRLPAWAPGSTMHLDDYQDAPHWRWSTAWSLRMTHRVSRHVIVPMTFSNVDYLDEIRDRLSSRGIPHRHFCLTADEPVIRERLVTRGLVHGSPEAEWVLPRVTHCCTVHAAPAFADHIPTGGRTPGAIATDILRLAGLPP